MASFVLTDCRVFHAGLDLTGQTNKVTVTTAADEVDGTTFADGGYKNTKAGLRSGTFHYEGFGDFSAGADGVLLGLVGATAPVMVSRDGTAGSPAYHTNGQSFGFSPLDAGVGELSALSGDVQSAQSAYGMRAGKLVAAKQTITSTTSTTGQQLFSAGSVNLVTGAVHVFAASGTSPSVTAKIQSSSTLGGSYTDRVTFAALTDVGGAYISAVLAAVTDQYWRVTFTVSGTSPSLSVAASVAVSP